MFERTYKKKKKENFRWKHFKEQRIKIAFSSEVQILQSAVVAQW
jgi:hypothetical protein